MVRRDIPVETNVIIGFHNFIEVEGTFRGKVCRLVECARATVLDVADMGKRNLPTGTEAAHKLRDIILRVGTE